MNKPLIISINISIPQYETTGLQGGREFTPYGYATVDFTTRMMMSVPAAHKFRNDVAAYTADKIDTLEVIQPCSANSATKESQPQVTFAATLCAKAAKEQP